MDGLVHIRSGGISVVRFLFGAFRCLKWLWGFGPLLSFADIWGWLWFWCVCVCVCGGGGAHWAGGLISISRGFFASVGGVFVLVGVLGAGLSLCGALGL